MKTLLVLMSMLVAMSTYSQSNTTSGGESVNGISYTIGQVFQQNGVVNDWSIMEGVQQPYELHVHTAIKDVISDKNISIYPNPVQRILSVKFNTLPLNSTNISIYNISGRKVYENALYDKINTINMSSFTSGVYLLKINNKTFKIIKR